MFFALSKSSHASTVSICRTNSPFPAFKQRESTALANQIFFMFLISHTISFGMLLGINGTTLLIRVFYFVNVFVFLRFSLRASQRILPDFVQLEHHFKKQLLVTPYTFIDTDIVR